MPRIEQSLPERGLDLSPEWADAKSELQEYLNREERPMLKALRRAMNGIVDLNDIPDLGVASSLSFTDIVAVLQGDTVNQATLLQLAELLDRPMSRVLYVDQGTTVPEAYRVGSHGRPYGTLLAAIARAEAIGGDVSIHVGPGDYSAEGEITGLSALTSLHIVSMGGVIEVPNWNVSTTPEITFERVDFTTFTGGFLRLTDSCTQRGLATVSRLFAVRSTFTGLSGTFVICSGTSVNMDSCFISNTTPNHDITFSGAAGTFGVDALTNAHWKADVGAGAAAGLTNGTKLVVADTVP